MTELWLARDIGGGGNKDKAVHLFVTEPFLGKAEDKEEGFFFSSAEHSRVTRYNRCPGDHLGFHQEYLKSLLQPGQKVSLMVSPVNSDDKGIRTAKCCGSCKHRHHHTYECSKYEVIVATIHVCDDKWELKE